VKVAASVHAALRYRVGMQMPFLAALAAATISTFAPAAAASDAVPLFNGKDLSGWIDVNTSAST